MTSPRIPFHEKFAYGLGNFMPTAVTATGGMAMYFYTDVAGLSAAFIGALLLLVRVIDAFWDIWVGRRVDATRSSRFGQARPYLLWFAPVLAIALVASFSVPPLEGAVKTVYYVLAYIGLWCAYSLIQIPFQSMMPMIAPDPDERLRLSGVSSFVQFIFVVACAAGFPMLKDALSGGVPAQGFQRAALVFAGLGLVMTWLCFAFVRERVPPMSGPPSNLRTDFRALLASKAWRAGVLAQCALATLIGLPLASGVYYFAVVVGQPQLVGPYMGLGGIGLVLGVVLADQLTRRICKKRVYVGSMLAAAVFLTCMVLGSPERLPLVFVLSLLANICLGVSAPISFSLNGDIADDIERREGQRVVGTLIATINFSNKVGAGLCSGIVGLVLSITAYQAGAAQQAPLAQQGVIALMSFVPALMALSVAAIMGWGYPLGRAQLQQLSTDLSQRRAAATVAA